MKGRIGKVSIGVLLSGKIADEQKFIKELKTIAENKKYIYCEYEDESIISVCHMGDIFVKVENNTATIDTSTNLLGAGYHKYICDFFAEIAELFIEVHIEDDTEYFQHRNFHRMKEEHFYSYLSNLIKICCENIADAGYVCWATNNYTPKHIDNTVVSPFGRINLDDWLSKINDGKVAELAEEFYIWSNEEKDGRYYRNYALSLMWEKLYYIKGNLNSEEDEIASQIVDYLEKSVSLNENLPFPIDEYLELCELHDRKPITTSNLTSYISKYQIGYHKDITYNRYGNIKVAILPKMACENSEDADIWYNDQEDFYNFRVSAYRVPPEKAVINDSIFETAIGEVIALNIGKANCKVAYVGKQGNYHSSIAVIASDEQITFFTFCYANEENKKQVVEHLKMFEVDN